MGTNGLWLVVTGTGRCGTKFTNMVLNGAGISAKQQFIFRPGRGGPGSPEVLPELSELVTVDDIRYRVKAYKASDWGPQAETSWLAAPYLGLPEMGDIVKVHLVRHPKRVIDSLVKVQVFERRDRYGLYTNFAYHWVPEMREIAGSAKERAALFYLLWNEMAEQGADHFWRVEDGPAGMLDMLGIEYEGPLFDDTSYNGRLGPHVDTRLTDLEPWLAEELLAMAERYGYTFTPWEKGEALDHDC